MRLFSLRNSAPTDTSVTLWVEGQHRWRLPNYIGCPECGMYGSIGPGYPSTDLSGLEVESSLRDPRGVSVRQLAELQQAVAPRVPPGAPVPGGTGFGPFSGRLRGARGDLVLADISYLLMRVAAYDALRAAGVRLPRAVPVDLTGRDADRHPLVEVELLPGASLEDASFRARRDQPCGTCGRWERTLEHIIVRAASCTADVDVFRAANHLPVILATEQFVTALEQLALRGLAIAAVEISRQPPNGRCS